MHNLSGGRETKSSPVFIIDSSIIDYATMSRNFCPDDVFMGRVSSLAMTDINVVYNILEGLKMPWYAIVYDAPQSNEVKILFSLYGTTSASDVASEFTKIFHRTEIFRVTGYLKEVLPWCEAANKLVMVPPCFPQELMNLWQSIHKFNYSIHGFIHRNIESGNSLPGLLVPTIFTSVCSRPNVQILSDDGVFKTTVIPTANKANKLLICTTSFMNAIGKIH